MTLHEYIQTASKEEVATVVFSIVMSAVKVFESETESKHDFVDLISVLQGIVLTLGLEVTEEKAREYKAGAFQNMITINNMESYFDILEKRGEAE